MLKHMLLTGPDNLYIFSVRMDWWKIIASPHISVKDYFCLFNSILWQLS